MKRYRSMFILSLVLVAVMGLAACGDDDDDDSGGGDNDSDVFRASSASTSVPGALDDAADPDAPATGGIGYDSSLALDRKIIFTASLTIEADNVRSSFETAGLIARRVGGFVERSSLSTREGDDGETLTFATITVRVPVGEYDQVLNDLRAMNGTELVSEESGSTEVTEEYTDLQSRLRNLERTEAQYLTLLEQARTINDILTVNDRLDGVRAQIEQIQGRLNLLDDLTELATVSVTLSPVEAAPFLVEEDGGGIPTFVEVLEAALAFSAGALMLLAAGSAVLLVALAWLIVPGLIYIGARFVRRKEVPANV
jgi:hypothetical protein